MIQRYPWKRKNFHPFGDQRKQWKLIWMRRICGQCKVYDGRWLSGYIFIHSWARRCIYRYTRVYRGTQRRGQPWAGGGKPPNLPGSYSQAWSLDLPPPSWGPTTSSPWNPSKKVNFLSVREKLPPKLWNCTAIGLRSAVSDFGANCRVGNVCVA